MPKTIAYIFLNPPFLKKQHWKKHCKILKFFSHIKTAVSNLGETITLKNQSL